MKLVDEPVADESLGQLRAWKQSENARQLAEAALDPSADQGFRMFAARYLAEFSDQFVVDALTKLLNDPEPRLRQRAARSLAEIGPNAVSAVPALSKTLFDGEGNVRVAAARALGSIGDPSAIPHLVKAADTTSWGTLHAWVTSSLVELKASEAVAHLIRRLEAPKAWQRRWAAKELAAVGPASALAPLRDARKRDPLHRQIYTRAIRKIELRATTPEAEGAG